MTIPIECPCCGREFDASDDGAEWEFDHWDPPCAHYRGFTADYCPHCGRLVVLELSGTALGHPDVGNPIEDVDVTDVYPGVEA